MRKALLLLTPLLLAGCVDGSASYYVDGAEHTLSVRAAQEYFWDKNVQLKVVLARLPECQRAITLDTVPMEDLSMDLFSPGENVYTLRVGEKVWQFETTACTELPVPAVDAYGAPLGVFHFDEEHKLVFEEAAPAG